MGYKENVDIWSVGCIMGEMIRSITIMKKMMNRRMVMMMLEMTMLKI